MEPIIKFKQRTKIYVIVGQSKVTFSGNRTDTQIQELASGLEIRANKLATGFRFRALDYRPQELTFQQIIDLGYVVKLMPK